MELNGRPIATPTGVGNGPGTNPPSPFSGNCRLFGTTTPFSASQLARLYASHGRFVSRWDRAALQDVARGYLLITDAVELMKSAAASHIGG